MCKIKKNTVIKCLLYLPLSDLLFLSLLKSYIYLKIEIETDKSIKMLQRSHNLAVLNTGHQYPKCCM